MPSVQAQRVIKSYTPSDELNIQEKFYESPLTQIPSMDVEVNNNSDNRTPNADGYIPNAPKPPYGDKTMPLFKQFRIRATNYFRQKDIDRAEKLEKENNRKNAAFKHINVQDDNEVTLYSTPPVDEVKINSEINEPEAVTNTNLIGGVKEQAVAKDAILDAENVDFNNKTMDVTATGKPVLTFPGQNTTLKADKIVYNNVSNILKAYDNVEIIKDGKSIYGDFIQINMNEENSFIDNLTTTGDRFVIHAKKATSDDKEIVLTDGNMESSEDYVFRLKTAMVAGFDYTRMLISDEDKSFLTDVTGQKNNVQVKVKDITIDAKRNHNVITANEIEVYNGKRHLFDIRGFQAHTNKDRDYFEGNYPEVGSRNPMGFWVGPGYVLDVPNGATLKLMPLLNYKNKIGFGGALKYRSATNLTTLMYGSSKDIFVLKGKQYLDDKLYLQYGINAFLDEWFLGARMPKYSIEAVYTDGAVIPNTFGKNLNTTFKNRVSAGYIGDTKYTLKDEHLPQGKDSTVRLRYMAEIAQSLYNYTDKENLKMLDLSLVLQGSAAIYGTGDTQFIGRVGPRLHSQYKYWMQDIGYFASAYHDETPLTRYDTYRYGHANVYFREAIRLNKYLALAWTCSVNILKEAPNGKLLQENGFLVSLGPDDFKVNFGYDFIREATFFNLTMGLNTKDSSLEYKKMVIKNPDRLSSSEPTLKEIPRQNEFVEVGEKSNIKPVKHYAEVIEIEDPDRERIE